MASTVERPAIGKFNGFHHVEFLVGNALQAASYYTTRFGFRRIAYKGLETGSRDRVSHACRQGDAVFVFTSPLNPNDPVTLTLAKSGDGAMAVAFNTEDVRHTHSVAVSRGAVSVSEPTLLESEEGSVWVASIKTYGDTVHTFVQNVDFKGPFLPGFSAVAAQDPLEDVTPSPGVMRIDHIVGNQPDLEMTPTVEMYEKLLDFHRFWSVDDKMIHTSYSSLRSIVVADFDETIKMPINEPAAGYRKSQIQEFVDYYGGAGVQHIALLTDDIIVAVQHLRSRGVNFLDIPDAYYDNMKEKLKTASITVAEDIETLRKLRILIDYDEGGYLLQLFTKPLEDRPTFFIEIIQRRNHTGFGAGNFKSLFECIERDQEKRGNLV